MLSLLLGMATSLLATTTVSTMFATLMNGAPLMSVANVLAFFVATIWCLDASRHASAGVTLRFVFTPGVCAVFGHTLGLVAVETVTVMSDGTQHSEGVTRSAACTRCLTHVGD